MSVDEVMEVVLADRAFYETSGGGLTISGGEPTVQFDFCVALLTSAKEKGIHTCLDTCGYFPAERLPLLLPLVDLWHYDYKATGAAAYAQWTGVEGKLIMENLATLQKRGAAIRLRCPLVLEANATPGHLARIDELESSGAFEAVERLPYHTTGHAKYLDLGRPVPVFRH
jgi:pyruvate formate lyase activating enzyme